MTNSNTCQTILPTKIIKNLNIIICENNNTIEQINTPISTYETTLFASIQRGAKVSQKSPINTIILDDVMTRSAIFECKNINDIEKLVNYLKNEEIINNFKIFQQIVDTTSKHCKIKSHQLGVIGNLLYYRLSYFSYEASGHNITTIATNEIAKYIVDNIQKSSNIDVKYISNSGNICCDKKVSAINSISGRGKKVIAEIIVSKQNCKDILHTTPEKVVKLNIQKNLIGSTIAGSICSANAHYANMLASLYLPFGQDIANIVEGSQGVTYCKVNDDGNLYFSVNLPNIICGCIGNGKNIKFVKENLKMIGCINDKNELISNASRRMACIFSGIVLCGELSLMSALTNTDELVKAHKIFER